MAEEIDEGTKLYAELKTEIWKRELSNCEKLDNAILTYSSAGLAVSLTLLKGFISINEASHKWCLYSSWLLFCIAIISTIVSYFISNKGLEKQLKIGKEYYIDGKEEVEVNIFNKINIYSTYLSGFSFIFAVLFSVMFVFFNVKGVESMSDKKSVSVFTQDAASIPMLQTLQKAAPIPAIQLMQSQQPQTVVTTPEQIQLPATPQPKKSE